MMELGLIRSQTKRRNAFIYLFFLINELLAYFSRCRQVYDNYPYLYDSLSLCTINVAECTIISTFCERGLIPVLNIAS